jgi:predicted TIM-barrel fold metal-dependent hydrolase
MGVPVIDFHIHPVYYEWHGESSSNWVKNIHADKDWQKFYTENQDPDYFVKFLKANTVDYGVILAELCPAVTGMCTNEYVLQFCKGQDALIPFANINPYLVSDLGQELQNLVDAGCRGLKLLPTYQYFYPNEPLLYPLYARAQELQIPVMLHTGSSVFKGTRLKYGDPLFLDDVAVDFPHLNIVLVHGGRGFWYDHAYFLARLHPNVYLEIAGLPPQNIMKYFPEIDKITDKVIFGSDWPGLTDLKGNIDTIRQLPLSKEAIDQILGGNAARLLNIDYTSS